MSKSLPVCLCVCVGVNRHALRLMVLPDNCYMNLHNRNPTAKTAFCVDGFSSFFLKYSIVNKYNTYTKCIIVICESPIPTKLKAQMASLPFLTKMPTSVCFHNLFRSIQYYNCHFFNISLTL